MITIIFSLLIGLTCFDAISSVSNTSIDVLTIPEIACHILSYVGTTKDLKSISMVNSSLRGACTEHAKRSLPQILKERISDSPFELHLKYAALSGNTWDDLKEGCSLFNSETLPKFLMLIIGHSVRCDDQFKDIFKETIAKTYTKIFRDRFFVRHIPSEKEGVFLNSMLKESMYATVLKHLRKENDDIIFWDEVPGEYPGVVDIRKILKVYDNNQMITNMIEESSWLEKHKGKDIIVIFPNSPGTDTDKYIDMIANFLSSYCIIREIHGMYPAVLPDNCILRVPSWFWWHHCGGGFNDHSYRFEQNGLESKQSDEIFNRDIRSYDFFDLPGIVVYLGLAGYGDRNRLAAFYKHNSLFWLNYFEKKKMNQCKPIGSAIGIGKIIETIVCFDYNHFVKPLAENMYSLINKKIFFYYFERGYECSLGSGIFHGEFIEKLRTCKINYERLCNNNKLFELLINSFPIEEIVVDQKKCDEWLQCITGSHKVDTLNIPVITDCDVKKRLKKF